MHLLYADDSGSVQHANQEHVILAGFSIFERFGYFLSQDLDQIAARFRSTDPASLELHGSPMLNGIGEWRTVPRADRIQAIRDALQVFTRSNRNNRIFAAVVRKSRIAPRDPVEFCFEQLCSRFDQYLMRLFQNDDKQRGIIVFDKSASETPIQSLARDFRRIGHTWGVVRNLAEVPLFIDSRASRLVQLADLIAYSIFRKFERNDSQFFDLISPRFDADKGTVHGLYQYV